MIDWIEEQEGRRQNLFCWKTWWKSGCLVTQGPLFALQRSLILSSLPFSLGIPCFSIWMTDHAVDNLKLSLTGGGGSTLRRKPSPVTHWRCVRECVLPRTQCATHASNAHEGWGVSDSFFFTFSREFNAGKKKMILPFAALTSTTKNPLFTTSWSNIRNGLWDFCCCSTAS